MNIRSHPGGIAMAVLLPCVLSSCVTSTEAVNFAAEDELVLLQESFQRRAVACRRAGGMMIVTTDRTRIRKRSDRSDYVYAECAR